MTRRRVEQLMGEDGGEDGAEGRASASRDSDTHLMRLDITTRAATPLLCLANCEPGDKLDFFGLEDAATRWEAH